MPKKIKFIVRLLLVIIAVAISSYYIFNHLNEFKKIFQLNWYEFIILSVITIASLASNGLLYKILLRHFNIDLKFKEWFGLTALHTYSNYLFIRGGLFIRGIYLKKFHRLSYTNFIVIFGFMSIIQIFCISLFSVFAMLFKYFISNIFNIYLFIFFALLALVSLIPFLLSEKLLKFLTKRSRHLLLATNEWLKIRKRMNLMVPLAFFIIIYILLFSLRIFLIYNMLFEPIQFSSAIIMASIGFLSIFISLTPASLGIKEALMSYAMELMGGKFATAAVVASLDRAIVVIWVFAFGFLFTILYSKKIS